VVINNETLAKLKRELGNFAEFPEPSADCIALTAELFHAVATIYDSKAQRGNDIYSYLERLLGTIVPSIVPLVALGAPEKFKMVTEVDAVVLEPIQLQWFGKKKVVLTYVKLKNDPGIRGDGRLQASLSLRKYMARKHVESLLTFGFSCH
jgi:hypothetical protein